MAKSEPLASILQTPGVFFTDNSSTTPFDHSRLGEVYIPNNLLFSVRGTDYWHTNAPFHSHNARDAKSDVLGNFFAAHIVEGESRRTKIGLKGVTNSNKLNHISGSALFFSSVTGPPRSSNEKDHDGDDDDQWSGSCLQVMTDNMVPHPAGVLLGLITPDELYLDETDSQADEDNFFNSVARWCTPVGIQFRWSSRGSNNHASALNFHKLGLVYMDNWMPGRTLYMPLIEPDYNLIPPNLSDEVGGRFVNKNSYYNGSNPFSIVHGSSASTNYNNEDLYGEIVAYAEPEVQDYLADPFTRAVCVGAYIEFAQPKGQGANYNMGREIFETRLLFDMPDKQGNFIASKSLFVYTKPHKLKEALYGDNIPLS